MDVKRGTAKSFGPRHAGVAVPFAQRGGFNGFAHAADPIYKYGKNRVWGFSGIEGPFLIKIWRPGGPGGI